VEVRPVGGDQPNVYCPGDTDPENTMLSGTELPWHRVGDHTADTENECAGIKVEAENVEPL
jgi:hypothetical protein